MENIINSEAVVLFSSGIDSLACLQWARLHFRSVVGLYVNLHTKYSQEEMQRSMELCAQLNVQFSLAQLPLLGEFESKDGFGHIPMRNIFLLECAALCGYN